MDNYEHSVLSRFLRYVKIETTSVEDSPTFPSDLKQLELSKLLVKELKDEIGLEDAHLDENGYVMATLPGNTEKAGVDTIGFIAHVDTSCSVSGKDVCPIVWRQYDGISDIVLPQNDMVIKVEDNGVLRGMKGYDIVTSDGSTLLGADDKAGIAEIMDAILFFKKNPHIPHGTVKVCFTPDEEVGRGAEKFDVAKFNAKYAYTIDGGERGEVEMETFSADSMTIKFFGHNVHPGYAKDKMINSIRVASAFLDSLPKEYLCPEKTSGREGYVHCKSIEGVEEMSTCKFIIRDFEEIKLNEYEDFLEKSAKEAVAKYPGASYKVTVNESYRNMAEIVRKYPDIENNAIKALKKLKVEPIRTAIRGGTDGSRLSFMGLPTPNLFAGGHNFHSCSEFVAVQDLECATKMIIAIIQIVEEDCN